MGRNHIFQVGIWQNSPVKERLELTKGKLKDTFETRLIPKVLNQDLRSYLMRGPLIGRLLCGFPIHFVIFQLFIHFATFSIVIM
jgi:hypothetical protein